MHAMTSIALTSGIGSATEHGTQTVGPTTGSSKHTATNGAAEA